MVIDYPLSTQSLMILCCLSDFVLILFTHTKKNMELKWNSFITCMYTYIHTCNYDWEISVEIFTLCCFFSNSYPYILSLSLYSPPFCISSPHLYIYIYIYKIYIVFSAAGKTAAHRHTHSFTCGCFLPVWQS